MKVMIGIVCLVLAIVGCSRNESNADDEIGKTRRMRKLIAERIPPPVSPTADERRIIENIYREVAFAYTNGEVAVIQNSVSRLTNLVNRLAWYDYNPIVLVAERPFNERFLRNGRVMPFSSVNELSDYLNVNLAMADLLGRCGICRIGHEDTAAYVELMTFYRLNQYRDHYRKSGPERYAETVENSIARWLEHVESEEGFSRTAARRCLVYSFRRMEVVGDITYEQAIVSARWPGLSFVKHGYTPRWLNAEFPLPAASGVQQER